METSPQATPAEPEFAAFLAIDWADQKHDWMLRSAAGGRVEQGQLEHTPEAIQAWAAQLRQRFGGQPIAVCLEQSRGALIYQLSVYPELVLYPVHPQTVAHYRRAWHPSGAKDDPLDTELLLEILEKHRGHLRPLVPDSQPTRKLRLLVELRRRLVDERTRHSNQLTDQLKQYFPQVLRWFHEPTSGVVGALLNQWPTLEQLQQQQPASLRQFLRQHHVHGPQHVDQLLEQIRQAVPATRDPAIVEASVLAVRAQLRLLAGLRESITELDRQIRQVTAAHPDYPIFASLPAAGQALEPRLLVLFGSDRNRYHSAAEVATFSGIAPVQQKSGRQWLVRFRRSCPKFLRQTLHEWAGHTLAQCAWARAFYDAKRAAGLEHHAAVRALAYKWVRILYRCWKDRLPYQEELYLAALRRHGSPLARPEKTAENPAPEPAGERSEEYQFKKVAGFWKFSPATP